MLRVAQAGGANRRDVDANRQAAFRAAGSEQKERQIDSIYGDSQLHLQILGVHPDHWRRKIGTQLVRWGMEKATRENIPLTVVAGPLGLHLYSDLGFKNLGEYITQVPGEEEKVSSDAMVYEPLSQEILKPRSH